MSSLTVGARVVQPPIKYRVKDLPRLRKKYHPGQHITVTKVREDGEEKQRHPQRKEYIVVERYPRHVGCVDLYGHRESFGYVELEQIVV